MSYRPARATVRTCLKTTTATKPNTQAIPKYPENRKRLCIDYSFTSQVKSFQGNIS